jgi:serine protease Do
MGLAIFRRWVFAVSFCLAGCSTFDALRSEGTVNAASPASRGFSAVLGRAMPSIVGVYGLDVPPDPSDFLFQSAGSPRPRPRGEEQAPWSGTAIPTRIGSGFFIDGAGTIVTAAHVVADAEHVVVRMADQRVLEAEVVDQDSDLDVAVLRVRGADMKVPAFGRSAASRPGDWVLAVGEPFGLARSVAAGIVSGRARHFVEDNEGMFIQSDVSLNPGNSGGPLLNANGEIIGMNLRTMVGPLGSSGLSLSLPIETVLQVAAELAGGTSSLRPRLGVRFEDVSVRPHWKRGALTPPAHG